MATGRLGKKFTTWRDYRATGRRTSKLKSIISVRTVRIVRDHVQRKTAFLFRTVRCWSVSRKLRPEENRRPMLTFHLVGSTVCASRARLTIRIQIRIQDTKYRRKVRPFYAVRSIVVLHRSFLRLCSQKYNSREV